MQDLLTELETQYGGKITWRTFSLWYADSDKNIREYGVFVFLIGNTIRFRDFEYTPKVLGFEIKRKNKPPYVQFNGDFELSSVNGIDIVCKSAALNAVKTGKKAKKSNILSRFFRNTVLQVSTDNKNYYFQFPDKEFRKLVEKQGETK